MPNSRSKKRLTRFLQELTGWSYMQCLRKLDEWRDKGLDARSEMESIAIRLDAADALEGVPREAIGRFERVNREFT